jgi:prevent-host-death family protein
MKIVSVADAKAKLSAYLKESQEGPIIVTRNGKPVGVLLPVENEEDLERLIMAYSPRFQKIMGAAKQQILDTGGIQHGDFWEQIESEASSIDRKPRGKKAA